jgi:hypothetical protein
MTLPVAPPAQREPAAARIAIVTGERTPYDMFDIESFAVGSVRVRTPLLLEIGEEVSLRIERGNESTIVRARVAGHDASGDEAVTTLSVVGDDSVARRLLGA